MITETVFTTAALETDFCPYKGLQPYTEADRAYFFGRDRDREIIISNLYAAPLTVLYGTSGVGKSSVLLAGVVPQLKETPRLAVSVFRSWQGNFLATLKESALDALKESLGKDVSIPLSLPLDEFLAQCGEAMRGQIFLILDQFEEYFLYHPLEAASDFDAEFARAVNRQEISANFLLCMREDSLSKLDRFKKRISNLLANMLRLDHLDRDSAIAAIREPVLEYNRHVPAERQVQIEDELVEALIEEVKPGQVIFNDAGQGQAREIRPEKDAGTRIETPLLQMVLTRLWNEELRAGSHTIRLQTLTSLGGAESIARTHLDKVMEQVKGSERDDAASLLRFLVTPSGAKIAQEVGALASWSGLPEERVRSILTRLGDQDIRILRPVQIPGQPVRYEIFHDVLAAAVLDWWGRYDEQQRREEIRREEQARREQEEAEAERRRAAERARYKRLLRSLAVLSIVLIGMAVLLYMAVSEKRKAKIAEAQAIIAKQELEKQNTELKNLREQTDKLNQQLEQKVGELEQKKQELQTLNDEASARLNQFNATPFLLKGQVQLQSSNYREAIKALTEAHKLDPSNPATSTLLGYARIMDKDLSGAIQILEETVRDHSDYGWAHYNLALAYLKTERRDDALNEIRTLLKDQPSFWQEFEKDVKFKDLRGSQEYIDLINQARNTPGPRYR